MKTRTEVLPNPQAIAHARVEAGYSKLDVARAAGIPHSSVIRAERGQGVSAKTAAGICKALGRRLDDLFTVNCPGGTGEQAREGVS